MCFKIKLKSALKNALSFSLDSRRISVMFSVILITGFAILFSIVSFAAYLPTDVVPFNKMAATVPNYAGNLIMISIMFAVILALSIFLSIVMKGVFIHNYTIRDSKDGIIKSIDALGGRLKPLINLTLLIILVSIVFDPIPFFGGIVNFIFTLAVFFAYQEAIIAKKGALDSIKGSFAMFKDSWRDVIASIIAITVSAFIIIALFSLPFIAAIFVTIAGMPVTPSMLPSLSTFSAAIANNILSFIVGGAILVIGLAIATLFGNAFTTEAYLQLKGIKTEASKATVAVLEAKKPAKRKPAKKKTRRKK